MKNFLILLFFILISSNSFSQFDPSQKQYIGNFNELINPSFAQGTVGWTATGTGVSFTVGATGAITNNSYAALVTFSSSPTTASFGQTITNTSPMNQQYAGIYATTTATTLAMGIKVNGTLTNSRAISGDGLPHYYDLAYVGTTNREIIIYPTATTTATISVTGAYNGVQGKLVQELNGAQFFGSITVNNGCSGVWSTNSTSYISFSAVTGCSYTVEGNAQAPSTIIPGIKFSSMPAGDYLFVYSGYAINNTANKSGYLKLTNGTQSTESFGFAGANAAGIHTNGWSAKITLTSALINTTFEMQGKVDSGSTMSLYNAADYPFKIMVYYFPPKSLIYFDQCQSDIECTNDFTAKISKTGTVSAENLDWINGNASITLTSLYALTFNSNVFGVAPTCTVSTNDGVNSIGIQEWVTATTGGGSWYTYRTDSTAAIVSDFRLVCTRSSTDYKARRTIVGTFQNVKTAPSIVAPREWMLFYNCSSSSSISYETFDGTPTVGNISSGECTFTIPSGNFTDISKVQCDHSLTAAQDSQYTFLLSTYTSSTSIAFKCGRYTGSVCNDFTVRTKCTQY